MKTLGKIKWCMLAGLLWSTYACESFLEIDPPRTQIGTETVYNNDDMAIAAVMGIYSDMTQNGFARGGTGSMTFEPGLSADELINFSNVINRQEFYSNSLQAENSIVRNTFWSSPYAYINNVNKLLEGLNQNNGVSTSVKTQLMGEAYFIRAFCNFYLVNLFGDIPLILSTDFEENRLMERTSEEVIYRQIIDDLLNGEELLSNDYSFSEGERIRPNTWAAKALLARIYLYREDYLKAEEYASMLINNNNFSLLQNLDDVFLANSMEAIWQLKPVTNERRTNEVMAFIIQTTPPDNVALSEEFLHAFEDNDTRKEKWIGSISNETDIWFYAYKYKDFSNAFTEYSTVLRLAEQYLIRAEARTMQGNIAGAIEDLDMLRERANLPLFTDISPDIDQSTLLDAIMHERQVELFVEWGHRWLDLKRMEKADDVLEVIKGSNWQFTDILYPIPQSELEANPNLTQNPGYN